MKITLRLGVAALRRLRAIVLGQCHANSDKHKDKLPLVDRNFMERKILNKKLDIRGPCDGLTGKDALCQAQGPEFDPPDPPTW